MWKILCASYNTLRSLGPAHLFAFNQGTDVNSTCGKVVCQTIDFSPWIFRPGAPTPILQPLCAGCRRGAHDEGCGVHNAHGEHVHVVAQWGGFLHPRHWQCSPAAAATPLLLYSAAASTASTAPLLLLLLLQQIPNFLLSDAARPRHSTVPLVVPLLLLLLPLLLTPNLLMLLLLIFSPLSMHCCFNSAGFIKAFSRASIPFIC